MCEESDHFCTCPLEGVIDTISKKWALVIITTLGNHGRLRFNRLMHELEGISPKTLTDTLASLLHEGFIGREAFSEIPPRVEYFLTDDGIKLREAIIPLMKWAAGREIYTSNGCLPGCNKKPGQPHHKKRRAEQNLQ